MKVKASIKVEQAGDKIVKRKKRLVRINKQNPRRKARQG
jgi:ribosomal protein L36